MEFKEIKKVNERNNESSINGKGKDFIAREAKWTLSELAMELKAIKEKPLTEEYLKKFDRMEFLDKEIHRIEYEVIPELINVYDTLIINNVLMENYFPMGMVE